MIFPSFLLKTLSVIYEQFLHLSEAGHAVSRGKEAGAYYTPAPLIAFIQEELEKKRPLTEGMKILDPSCGSGAFLVQCYRRLIEKQLQKKQGQLRPNELRRILTSQIFGVDRDGDACRVAELSLILTLLDYITPPDLESNPTFALPNLKDVNIFEADLFDPDSSCAEITTTPTFDWVVGNPPWIELNRSRIREADGPVLRWIQDHVAELPVGGRQVAEAFVWKILTCLKPDGVAGLVLPAMTLFKKESTAFRKQFFAKTRSWCVANFSNLAYVLFSGRATRPALALFFQPLDSRGESDADEPILTYAPLMINQEANRPRRPRKKKDTWTIVLNDSEIQEVPTSKALTGDALPWKLAMWGNFRDGKLLERVARKFPSFREFAASHRLSAHEGFKLRAKLASSREQLDAKPELEGKKRVDFNKLSVDFNKLRGCDCLFVFPEDAFQIIPKEQCHIPRRGGFAGFLVSQPPHILLDEGRRFAVYSDEFIAVSPGQTGIAAPVGNEILLKALSLYLSSEFATYQQFFTTSQWGISTSIATLDALKNLPVPLDNLSHQEMVEWAKLRDTLADMSQHTLASSEGSIVSSMEGALSDKIVELHNRVYQALGLRESERILIRDFVQMNRHCIKGKVLREAGAAPSEFMRQSYVQRLKKELDAFIGDESGTQHEVVPDYEERYAIIAVRLMPENASQTVVRRPERIRERLQQRHSQWMYFNRNLRLYDYDHDTLYCLKPLQALHWTERQAILDAGEVIATTLATQENR